MTAPTTPSGVAVLGEQCRCGTRDEDHEPIMLLPLPVGVNALSALAKALDRVLAESGRVGVFLSDGHHPNGVIYAVPKRKSDRSPAGGAS